MIACTHDGILVVFNLSCAPDCVLQTVWPTKLQFTPLSIYDHFIVTLATTALKSDWEMSVLHINDMHRVRSASFDFNRRNWMPGNMLTERFMYVQHSPFYLFSMSACT